MKKVTFAVAVIISALVLGCQDGNYNPASTELSHGSMQFTRPGDTEPGPSLDVKETLSYFDSRGEEHTYDIVGTVNYELSAINDEAYRINIVFNANFFLPGEQVVVGSINSTSTEFATLTKEGTYTLKKTFFVRNMVPATELHVKFEVTKGLLVASTMWLDESLFAETRW